ncbi:hypothetical protein [Klebsiella aerogenes EA1509E]|nr:hypothetical protein [Klebsiella aerogenes EA1509E]
MQLKSQVKLINDCAPIRKATYPTLRPPSLVVIKSVKIIGQITRVMEYFPSLFY